MLNFVLMRSAFCRGVGGAGGGEGLLRNPETLP